MTSVVGSSGDRGGEEEVCLPVAAGGSGRRRRGWAARSSRTATQEDDDARCALSRDGLQIGMTSLSFDSKEIGGCHLRSCLTATASQKRGGLDGAMRVRPRSGTSASFTSSGRRDNAGRSVPILLDSSAEERRSWIASSTKVIVGGSRRLRSNSRGPRLRLKKRATVVAEKERRELSFDSTVACSRVHEICSRLTARRKLALGKLL
ncbi:hypothetical protein BHE74_00021253 [Ensete ventricosum]|nr:hypothetical protein GW17_00015524 [Ensete ventricosum]RWW71038.1 hypothetical protein BHE74_00021253 [Ensete ventricosum]RZR90162.1 hypothetical protein BHM03_00018001 [Ensete ventricosum]